jgi:hypothetical protein
MSSRGRLFTDDALTRTLDHWLADGPKEMPEVSVDAALRTVAITGQRRWRGRLLRFASASPMVPVGLTAATVAVFVTLAVAFGQILPPPATLPSPTVDSSSVPTPAPSDDGSGGVIYTNEEDGYEVTLPASWTPAAFLSDPPGAMRFGASHNDSGPSPFGAFTVSVGSPDGTVYDCAPAACVPIVATTIDDLDAQVDSWNRSATAADLGEQDVDITLDGVPARLETVALRGGLIEAGPQFHHVFTFHEGRPVILSFDLYAYNLGRAANSVAWVHRLIESFRFLDGDTAPTDPAEGERVPVQGTALSITLPTGWEICRPLNWEGIAYRLQSDCEQIAASPYWVSPPSGPSVIIQLGEDGDPPTFCAGRSGCNYTSPSCSPRTLPRRAPACEEREIRSLSGLWSALSVSDVFQLADTQQRDVQIDGGEARLVTASRSYFEGRRIVDRTWVLILRDRPYIISLSAPQGTMPAGWEDAVINSMDFTD